MGYEKKIKWRVECALFTVLYSSFFKYNKMNNYSDKNLFRRNMNEDLKF